MPPLRPPLPASANVPSRLPVPALAFLLLLLDLFVDPLGVLLRVAVKDFRLLFEPPPPKVLVLPDPLRDFICGFPNELGTARDRKVWTCDTI